MAKIEICKNGPYIVSGKIPVNQEKTVFDLEGNPLKTEVTKNLCSDEKTTLCRCGGSSNKPFCDGTHRQNGFDGTENPDNLENNPDDTEIFEGPNLTLKDTPHLCVGAGFCHRAGGVWNLTQDSDNPKSKKIAVEECHCCPSGRLVALDSETNKPIEEKSNPVINIDPNGPLNTTGDITLESADGEIYPSQTKKSLCRCGKSQNKPFCDGSHFN
jgi:CDGSH-type Zn-finger protein